LDVLRDILLEENKIVKSVYEAKKIICLLTVYFGTPNMFITLWFGLDYGTNPPLITLMI
jgi:hypothetical protein